MTSLSYYLTVLGLDWAMTWLSYYLTELGLDWARTWLSYDLTELLLDWARTDWAMTWLSYYWTELGLDWAMTWRSYYLTELGLDWARTWLSYYLTELGLDWAMTWLSYYLTELGLDWAIDLTELWLHWAITWLSFDFTELLLDWARTWLSYDLTELLLDWARTWLSYYLTELGLDWAMTWLSYYLTELGLDWAIDLTELWLHWAITWLSYWLDWALTSLSYYLTELGLDWAMTWLSYYLTELGLDWDMTWLSYYLTELGLDRAIDLTELWLHWAMTSLSYYLTELGLTELWLGWARTWPSYWLDWRLLKNDNPFHLQQFSESTVNKIAVHHIDLKHLRLKMSTGISFPIYGQAMFWHIYPSSHIASRKITKSNAKTDEQQSPLCCSTAPGFKTRRWGTRLSGDGDQRQRSHLLRCAPVPRGPPKQFFMQWKPFQRHDHDWSPPARPAAIIVATKLRQSLLGKPRERPAVQSGHCWGLRTRCSTKALFYAPNRDIPLPRLMMIPLMLLSPSVLHRLVITTPKDTPFMWAYLWVCQRYLNSSPRLSQSIVCRAPKPK